MLQQTHTRGSEGTRMQRPPQCYRQRDLYAKFVSHSFGGNCMWRSKGETPSTQKPDYSSPVLFAYVECLKAHFSNGQKHLNKDVWGV